MGSNVCEMGVPVPVPAWNRNRDGTRPLWDGMGRDRLDMGPGWDGSQAAYTRKVTRIDNEGPGFLVLSCAWDQDGMG